MKPYLFLFFAFCIIAGLIVSSAGATSPDAEEQWKTARQLFAGGKCPSALVASEKAISIDPQVGKYWNIYGCALHCLGRNQKSQEAFSRAIELDPGLDIAKKNLDHVQLEIRNGALLDTPPLVLPAIRNASIAYDGELGYVPTGVPTGCWALPKEGHAVLYTNNRTITVTGVRIAGCRYGTDGGKVRIEIWDENFTTLYSDTVPFDQIPLRVVKDEAACLTNSSWVDIDLPDHEVSGNFSIVLFTGSLPISMKEPGMYVVYDTPSQTGTSSLMTTNPNRPDVQKIGGNVEYQPEELDWMIRVLYTEPPSGTVTPGSRQALETPALKTQTAETPTPAPPSIPLGLASIASALAIVVSYSISRK